MLLSNISDASKNFFSSDVQLMCQRTAELLFRLSNNSIDNIDLVLS